MKILLKNGANIQEQDNLRQFKEQLNQMNLFLNTKRNLNIFNKSPWWIALENNSIESVELLIHKGIDIDQRNSL